MERAPTDNRQFAFAPSSLRLYPGWNLVSLPVSSDQTIAELFADGRSGSVKVGAVWSFDALPKTYQRLGDSSPLMPGKGCWVYSREGGLTQPIIGTRWTQTALELHKGWNLVGVTAPRTLAGSPFGPLAVYWWDAKVQTYRVLGDGALLQPGFGYWIHTPQSCVVGLVAQ